MLRLQLHAVLRYPSAVLLLVQLAGVLLYPLMEQAAESRASFGVFGVIVLGLALRMVRNTPGVTWFALLLASSIVALSIANVSLQNPILLLLMAALEAAFYFYAAGCLIAYMLQDDRATTDELFAAGATFTLLAWAFAYVYMVCQLLSPGSFIVQTDPSLTRTWMDLLFLSFTCLSGVGLGDIMPLQPMARALVMLEEFTGVMYIALVVSRLIGLTIRGEK
jgi:ion channel